MIETRVGTVIRIVENRPGYAALEVEVEGSLRRAVAYTMITGEVAAGDRVLLNTTAVALQLGSGGYDFVMVNLSRPQQELSGKGHIMKMRYTPWQVRVLSVEEEESPYRSLLESADSLKGRPVLVATLHSMLAPLAACLAALGLKIAYVMTDAASLPAYWSRTVAELREAGVLLGTVTAGNAFGGDLEAVNVFSAMLAADAVFKPDVIITAMGPGIVGTGTRWGFSGIEQGVIINAVESLQGRPVAVPRISFADLRERHRGLSHHTITVLTRVTRVKSLLPLPVLPEEEAAILAEQIKANDLEKKHHIVYADGSLVNEALDAYGLRPTTMGRNKEDDPAFFLALGAAAKAAAALVQGELDDLL